MDERRLPARGPGRPPAAPGAASGTWRSSPRVIPEVTTTQFAALAKLAEQGPLSQNQLGRATAMDAATIKGVVGRLVRGGWW